MFCPRCLQVAGGAWVGPEGQEGGQPAAGAGGGGAAGSSGLGTGGADLEGAPWWVRELVCGRKLQRGRHSSLGRL